jgi:hypothetical protein
MKHSFRPHFLILFFSLIGAGKGYSQNLYTLEDVRGESKACEQTLEEKNYNTLDKNIENIDIHLATDEIKREIIYMAESQVTLSLGLLQKKGMFFYHNLEVSDEIVSTNSRPKSRSTTSQKREIDYQH